MQAHIVDNPELYIGPTKHSRRNVLLYNYHTNAIGYKCITVPQALDNLFLEILNNASESVLVSRILGIESEVIEISMSDIEITVKNYGQTIPIIQKGKSWVPETIFGGLPPNQSLINSPNFGAKIVNYYSMRFIVVVEDSTNNLKYSQRWAHNTTIKTTPSVQKYNGNVSSVTVSYIVDFERFGCDGYSDDAKMLFLKYASDISNNNNITIVFTIDNNKKIVFSNL
jgi:DNA topoisomerase II